MSDKQPTTGSEIADCDNIGANNRASWSNKWTFVLAAAASAVGLGNFWRFPYLAAHYGGGTFLIMYAIFVFTIGISLLLLETSLGRYTGLSVIGAITKVCKKFKWLGILAALVPFVIGPYYFVVGGWVCKYVFSYLVVDVKVLADGGQFFANFQYGSYESYLFLLVFLALTFIVVTLGVNGGIEKANLVMMPTLIIVAIAIAIFIAFKPGAGAGLVYYFLPDFSVLSPELIINALGQTFYTLSLAMGIMITYGSYLKKKESLTKSVAQIGGFSFAVSLIAGMIIVPAAFMSIGHPPVSAGPSLMFITLPEVFSSMGLAAGPIGFLFFLLVLFAALTSSISVVETCVSIVCDTFNLKRTTSIIILLLFMTIGALFVNSGYNLLHDFRILNMEILQFFDFVTNSVMMPVVALFTCILIGWIVKPKILIQEVKISSEFKLANVWSIIIKYICPILILAILVSNIYTTFV